MLALNAVTDGVTSNRTFDVPVNDPDKTVIETLQVLEKELVVTCTGTTESLSSWKLQFNAWPMVEVSRSLSSTRLVAPPREGVSVKDTTTF